MTEQEMFIEALMSQFMEPEFQFPDIGRRVAELSIQNNDMTWRIWQAARTAPAARNAGLTEEDACECSATCEDKGGNKCRYITSEQKGALHFAIDLCDSMGSDAISEKLRMLLAAPETLPEAAPVAIYQIQAFKGSWDDCDKSVYDRQPVTLRRIVYKAAPASEPIAPHPAIVRAIAQEERACRAEDALIDLVNQIRKSNPVDDHGHDLKMNRAYLEAQNLLDEAAREGK